MGPRSRGHRRARDKDPGELRLSSGRPEAYPAHGTLVLWARKRKQTGFFGIWEGLVPVTQRCQSSVRSQLPPGLRLSPTVSAPRVPQPSLT